MPRGNRTGPVGMGPITGRAAGYCAGYPTPGFMNSRNQAFGGRGAGYRHMYYATGLPGWTRYGWTPPHAGAVYGQPAPAQAPFSPTGPEEEVEYLQHHAENLKQQLEDIEDRLKELDEE